MDQRFIGYKKIIEKWKHFKPIRLGELDNLEKLHNESI